MSDFSTAIICLTVLFAVAMLCGACLYAIRLEKKDDAHV